MLEIVITLVTASVTAFWAIFIHFRDQSYNAIERSSFFINRLLENDEIIIKDYHIQKYFSEKAGEDEEYFRKKDRLSDEDFFKAKSFAYRNLNLFDEILSIDKLSKKECCFLRPIKKLLTIQIVELPDWENYIKQILTHPLYQSILNNGEENKIFGESLKEFWEANRKSISKQNADPFIW